MEVESHSLTLFFLRMILSMDLGLDKVNNKDKITSTSDRNSVSTKKKVTIACDTK